MVRYRRLRINGAVYFFTVVLNDRKSNLLIDRINFLRASIQAVKNMYPFDIEAMVVLPDHFHALWTLPDGCTDYSVRMRLVKTEFTKRVFENKTHDKYRIWQNRFWEHTIRDEVDFENHVNYIHYNPVKHKLSRNVRSWPYSSFHRYVKNGILSPNWSDGGSMCDEVYAGE